eukprot:GHVS01085136.1.p1 GENE.GHVS01085136.1~~GHVS01085136.1.p1  ORF type:complete len:342 (+),score=54.61 GHVS01085136.1:132-1157(+)
MAHPSPRMHYCLARVVCLWLASVKWAQVVEASFASEQLETMYCGELNCYELLDVPRNSTTTEIKKAYRRLAVKLHPDRNPDVKAGEVFRRIAKAYNVLNTREIREAYDYYLDHPDDLYALYYGIRAVYPQKTNPLAVVVLTLAFISMAQYMNSRYQHQRIIRVIKNTQQFQKAVQQELENEFGSKLKKLTDEEQTSSKARAEEVVLSRVQLNDGEEIAPPMHWTEILFVRTCLLPYTLSILAKEQAVWFWRFSLMRDEYGECEKTYLTKKKAELTDVKWKALSDAEKKGLLEKQLWIPENYECYRKDKAEEEREKLMSNTRYRQWKRWKKKNPDTSYMMDD